MEWKLFGNFASFIFKPPHRLKQTVKIDAYPWSGHAHYHTHFHTKSQGMVTCQWAIDQTTPTLTIPISHQKVTTIKPNRHQNDSGHGLFCFPSTRGRARKELSMTVVPLTWFYVNNPPYMISWRNEKLVWLLPVDILHASVSLGNCTSTKTVCVNVQCKLQVTWPPSASHMMLNNGSRALL